ncbi:MAG: DUF4159 domain-containing protein [Pirellulaceae bacterium]|nr:DUF4159 domain-containing protein [Pirellulaceae bacterium]
MLTLLFGVAWLLVWASWLWVPWERAWLFALQATVFGASLPIAIAWLDWCRRRQRKRNISTCIVVSCAYLVLWQLGLFLFSHLDWPAAATLLARVGTAGSFLIGLAWTVWVIDGAGQRRERLRRIAANSSAILDDFPSQATKSLPQFRTNNPLDPQAWYYGRRNSKLNQSIAALGTYSLLFLLVFLFFSQVSGCRELYEMPAGGGQQKALAQKVKVQKIIKKKFVVNPFSAISFKVPPIDEVKLQLTEVTEHAYTVGYGAGAGAGFAGGTQQGQVRFIRLEYGGGDWDQDFGIGADVNMLIEYGIRTKQKVAKRTESRTISQLKSFPPEKSPPLVYLTGQRNISLSDSEIKVLRDYLMEKRGMIFGDNGGSGHFHNQFVGMMRRVLPSVRPTRIPLDDIVHRIPYQIPFLPYVAPHGGKNALGWRVDGRLVCYYHPGDIGDAWTDDHSGVAPEIYESCYQLGTNIIFYAHTEYSKWLMSRQKRE